MNRKQIFLLLFVCIVPFIGYFLNPNLAYFDSYAFLGGSCGLNQNYIIPFVPCSIGAVKLVLLGLYIVSIFSIAKFGENILEKNGWRVGFYSATLTPLLFQEAMKFENDIFAWSMIFLSFACFSFWFRAEKTKKEQILPVWLGVLPSNRLKNTTWLILACVLSLLSLVVWQGAFIGVFALSLMFIYFLVLTIPILLYNIPYFLGYFFKYFGVENQVSEEMMGAGIIPVMFLFWTLYRKPKSLVFPMASIFTFVVGLIKIKYMLFAVPFLALNFVNFENEHRHKKHWPNLLVVGLTFACVFSMMGFLSYPTTQQFETIDVAIGLATDNNILLVNDWDYGWLVEYKGYSTEYKASFPNPDWNKLDRPFVALTDTNLDCEHYDFNKPSVFICK